MEIILLAKGFEEIEAITIIDVLRRAEIPVKTVSITENKEVEGAHYISVVCDETLQNIAPNEIERVILPGGWGGTYALAENQRVLELIRAVNANHKEIAAICAAPYVLDKADVLNMNTPATLAWKSKLNMHIITVAVLRSLKMKTSSHQEALQQLLISHSI